MATNDEIRDLAYATLKDRGIDPIDATTAVWAAACDEARATLAAEEVTR